MKYKNSELLFNKTYNELSEQYGERGQKYIKTHWIRYISLLGMLPEINAGTSVLEIGASMLSSHIRKRFGADMHTVYHKLESEWPARLEPLGISCYSIELIKDPLPFSEPKFDLILCNEVIEHLPVRSEFLMKRMISILKPRGRIVLSVPNFAKSENRIKLLLGRNPQDNMDEKYVYYAHHREFDMREVLDMVRRCGGETVNKKWMDFYEEPSLFKTAYQTLRHLRHGNFHRLIHLLFPSTRSYIIVEIICDGTKEFSAQEMSPPIIATGEFQ